MGTFELVASYEEVVKAILKDRMFADEQEITDTLSSLIYQGILQVKSGTLRNKEIKFLLEYGDTRSNDKRALSFNGNKINKEILSLRSKLYQQFYYPK